MKKTKIKELYNRFTNWLDKLPVDARNHFDAGLIIALMCIAFAQWLDFIWFPLVVVFIASFAKEIYDYSQGKTFSIPDIQSSIIGGVCVQIFYLAWLFLIF